MTDDAAPLVEEPEDDVATLIAAAGAMTENFDAESARELFALSDLQYRYALCRLAGVNQTQSAKRAGYSPDKAGLWNGAGYEAERSPSTQRFLTAARSGGAGPSETVMDPGERKRILSKIARGGDRRTAVSAVQALERIEDKEFIADPATLPGPIETLHEIAALSPLAALFANELAKAYGLDFHSDRAPAAPASVAEWLHQHSAVMQGPVPVYRNGARAELTRGQERKTEGDLR